MSRLAQVLARVHDTIEHEYDVYPDHDGLAGLIDAELRDDDDLMALLADTAARSRRGPCAHTNEADERLVLDL